MPKYEYISNFKKDMENFIKLKHSVGYKYESKELVLRRFDRFCVSNFPNDTILNENIINAWVAKRDNESFGTMNDRISLVREFAKYIISTGNYAYVISTSFMSKKHKNNSYIFTADELKRFFRAIDNCNYKSYSNYTYLTLPVLFRVLYCCGLRVSEVLKLKVKDVNLDEGILSIYNAKNNNDRLVPMNKELTLLCKEYSKKMHIHSSEEDPFFYNKKYTLEFKYQTLEKMFERILNNAQIERTKDYNGARIHAFRHTFAINCYNRWIKENKDLSVYQVYLKTYMGHASFEETTYYLKLTNLMFSTITEKSDLYLKNTIPLLGGDWIEK